MPWQGVSGFLGWVLGLGRGSVCRCGPERPCRGMGFRGFRLKTAGVSWGEGFRVGVLGAPEILLML